MQEGKKQAEPGPSLVSSQTYGSNQL